MLSPSLEHFADCSSEILHARKSLLSSLSVKFYQVELVEVGGLSRRVTILLLRNYQIESETNLQKDSISRSNSVSVFALSLMAVIHLSETDN